MSRARCEPSVLTQRCVRCGSSFERKDIRRALFDLRFIQFFFSRIRLVFTNIMTRVSGPPTPCKRFSRGVLLKNESSNYPRSRRWDSIRTATLGWMSLGLRDRRANVNGLSRKHIISFIWRRILPSISIDAISAFRFSPRYVARPLAGSSLYRKFIFIFTDEAFFLQVSEDFWESRGVVISQIF